MNLVKKYELSSHSSFKDDYYDHSYRQPNLFVFIFAFQGRSNFRRQIYATQEDRIL